MTMQMNRAFNSKMMTMITKYTIGVGSYDSTNNWIEGSQVVTQIFGVIKAGNKFSQFEEGQALHAEDGGARYSDYRTLYVTKANLVELGDKLGFAGKYFNVLQRSDESIFGFYSVIIEESTEWTP